MTIKRSIKILEFFYFRSLIGKEECAPSLKIEQTSTSEQKLAIFTLFYKYLERVKRWPLVQNKNHPICTHEYHCLIHILLV